MSDFRKLFALALALSLVVALSLVGIASPALAQGDTMSLDPSSSSLTQEEDPPPPDDGDKDFDEWDNDVLNQTSPSLKERTGSPPAPSWSWKSWASTGWLAVFRSWLGVGAS